MHENKASPARQSIGEYVTLRTASRALGMGYWKLYRAVRAGQVPAVRLGQTLLVKLSDVEQASKWTK